MLAIQSINGTAPAVQPLRDGYQVTKSDLLSSGSGRTSTGAALRYPIRLGVYRLTLKFKGTSSEIAQVDTLVSSFEQTVIFLDTDGTYVSRNFYPSDRNLTANGFTAELSVNLIEI